MLRSQLSYPDAKLETFMYLLNDIFVNKDTQAFACFISDTGAIEHYVRNERHCSLDTQ